MTQGKAFNDFNRVLVAAGSNVPSEAGGRRETLYAALEAVSQTWGDVTSSHFYQTPAFPAGSGPDFINAAYAFTTNHPPRAILSALHNIEDRFGRIRSTRWGSRTLDLDLIAVGETVMPDVAAFGHWRNLPLDAQKVRVPDQLILPHPRVQDRAFVLVPLADVAPDWCHPVLGQTVTQMLAALGQAARAEIKRL